MPKSHICPSCLTELGRIRAVRDEHYGLPIVACPSCSLATVRTRHHDIEYWRRFRRTHWALRILLAKLAIIILGAGLLAGIASGSDQLFSPMGSLVLLAPLQDPDPSRAYLALGTLLTAIAVMVSVRLALHHRGMIFTVMLLLGLAFLMMYMDAILGVIGTTMARLAGFRPIHTIPKSRELIGRLERFGMFAGVSMLGLIPAFALRGLIDRAPARRFRRLLRKRRKQRLLHD